MRAQCICVCAGDHSISSRGATVRPHRGRTVSESLGKARTHVSRALARLLVPPNPWESKRECVSRITVCPHGIFRGRRGALAAAWRPVTAAVAYVAEVPANREPRDFNRRGLKTLPQFSLSLSRGASLANIEQRPPLLRAESRERRLHVRPP